ncbi:hypothetical protein Tco_0308326 [Tanacetum coccineum]
MVSSWCPQQQVIIIEEENAADEEKEAIAVWKSILKRKGLPSNTPYQYFATWPKDYDESYCDMLFIKAKRKTAEVDEDIEAAKEAIELVTIDIDFEPQEAHSFTNKGIEYRFKGTTRYSSRVIIIEEENAIDEEKEAIAVWKSILKQKGIEVKEKAEVDEDIEAAKEAIELVTTYADFESQEARSHTNKGIEYM